MIDLSDCKTFDARYKKLTTKYPEEAMHEICTVIAQGGSLITLCQAWRVHYGRVVSWCRADRDRSIRYTEATNDRVEWAKESVLFELRKIALSDVRSLFNKDGDYLPPDKWPQEVSTMIKSVEMNEDGDIKKIQLWNKEKCLELLGKNMSLFIDKVEHSGKVTLEDIISESFEETDDKEISQSKQEKSD